MQRSARLRFVSNSGGEDPGEEQIVNPQSFDVKLIAVAFEQESAWKVLEGKGNG